jgi:hypothetical protein
MPTTYYGPRMRAAGGTRVRISTGETTQQAETRSGCGRMISDVSPGGPPYVTQNSWEAKEQTASAGWCEGSRLGYQYNNWKLGPNLFTTNLDAQGNATTFTSPNPVFDYNYWKTLALTRFTFPSTTIDPALFIYEAREIPRMLYDCYRILSGRASVADIVNGQLMMQFGWEPLLADLRKLVDHGLYVDRVHRAIETKIERTQDSLGNWEEPDSISALTGLGTTMHLYLIHHTKVWFQGRWVPDTVPKLDSNKINAFAAAVENLVPWYSTAWNALPWSFVVDYFNNIGDILEARAGIVYRPNCLLIMGETRTRVDRFVFPPLSGITVREEPKYKGLLRRRYVFFNPSPSFGFKPYPWLRRSGTLMNLAVARLLPLR